MSLSLEQKMRLRNATSIFGYPEFSAEAAEWLVQAGFAERRKDYSGKRRWRLTPLGERAKSELEYETPMENLQKQIDWWAT